MAFTQNDLEAIDRAIADGTLSVEIEGKRITYRSMDDLRKSKNMIEAELAPMSGKAPVLRTFAAFSRE